MNHLRNGTIAVGAPDSEARKKAELEDADKEICSDCAWPVIECICSQTRWSISRERYLRRISELEDDNEALLARIHKLVTEMEK